MARYRTITPILPHIRPAAVTQISCQRALDQLFGELKMRDTWDSPEIIISHVVLSSEKRWLAIVRQTSLGDAGFGPKKPGC